MKSIFVIALLFMFASISGASIPCYPSASLPCLDSFNIKFKIRISIEHGQWDRENKKCLDEKGWCKIDIDIDLDRPASGEGGGDLWYENGRLNWVAINEKYTTNTFNAVLGGTTYYMPDDFRLADNICDALGIERGFIIKKGFYPISPAGNDYASADRKVIF